MLYYMRRYLCYFTKVHELTLTLTQYSTVQCSTVQGVPCSTGSTAGMLSLETRSRSRDRSRPHFHGLGLMGPGLGLGLVGSCLGLGLVGLGLGLARSGLASRPILRSLQNSVLSTMVDRIGSGLTQPG